MTVYKAGHERFVFMRLSSGYLIFITVIFAVCANAVAAEDLSDEKWTPMADIVNIIKDSGKYEYHGTYLDSKAKLKEYNEKLKYNDPNQIVVEKDGKRKVSVYEAPVEVKKAVENALKLEEKERYREALEILSKAQATSPDYSMIDVYRGRIAMEMDDYHDALKDFSEAIRKNPANFTAYRLRAKCHLKLDDDESAINDLIKSIICNRNDPESWKILEQLAEKKGYGLYRKPFLPLYSHQRMDNGKLRIYIDQDTLQRWMPYAFCKTVWKYHPGYFEKRTGEEEYRRTFLEEMECIRNLLWAYNAFQLRGNYKPDPVLERLEKIKKRFYLKEFVRFEVMGPHNPEVLVTVDEKRVADLVDYFREFIMVKDK